MSYWVGVFCEEICKGGNCCECMLMKYEEWLENANE